VLGAEDDEARAVDPAKSLSRAFRRAAERATPSVVTVISQYDQRDRANELRGLLQDGFTNVGSGVVTDAAGIVVTNNHVVAGADKVVVRLPDGTELRAEEIRTDRLSDLAVLRVETDAKLKPAKLGDSDALEIGDWVIAIGSPFELEATVSAGIISGKRRPIARIERGLLLQTDAAINPGNSGGPLVNLDGEVVGISTAIATNNGGYQGVGFAIPVNRAKWVSQELLQHGRVRRAYLGIKISELEAKEAGRLSLPARSGVWVWEVIPESPAAKAGLESDDVIVDFAGTAVRSPGDLQEAVERKEVGSTQKINVIRRGKRVTLDVTTTSLPSAAEQPQGEP
jgi:serine protease Do